MKYIYLLLYILLCSSSVFAVGSIAGATSACIGSATILTDTTSGGTWSSSNTAVAIIGSVTGVVNGVSAGTATISYTVGDTSVTAIVIINAIIAPSVSISTGTSDTICAGTEVVFTAMPMYGGLAPTYVWMLNHSFADTGRTYDGYPAPGDTITVTMTSSAACVSPDTAFAASSLIISPALIPSIDIGATPGLSITPGQTDTLKAWDTTGTEAALTYQWVVNSTIITGATNAVYITDSLADGDSVTCVAASVGKCGGYSAFNSVSISVGLSGIKPLVNNEDIAIYPNPNNGAFTIKGLVPTTIGNDAYIEVTDMSGRVIYKNKLTIQGSKLNGQINLDNISLYGIYLLNLQIDGERQVFPFIVQK